MITTSEDCRIEFSQGTLTVRSPSKSIIDKIFPKQFLIFDQRDSLWRSDAMHYGKIIKILSESDIRFEDLVPKWELVKWPVVNIHSLRADQLEAKQSWLRNRNGVLIMPTGTGKTEVALSIMSELACSSLVVSPIRDLMYQWHTRILKGLGYDAGIIGDNTFDVRNVSVTTYDSACIHMDKLGDKFKLIIFDECHHLPGEIRRDAARMSAAPYRLGLTATPERSDMKHLDLEGLIGPITYIMPIAEAKGSILADYDINRVAVRLSQEEQKKYNELSKLVRDYVLKRRKDDHAFEWEDLCAASGKDPEARKAQKAFYEKKSIENKAGEKFRVLEDLFRLHPREKVIVFAGSNPMAMEISKRFLIPCILNQCGKKERREIIDGFRDGTYHAIVANQILDEGVDIPEAKVAVIMGGNASTRQAKQRLGRILRKSGNIRAMLYEVVCKDTNETTRSIKRRKSDAYKTTRHIRI